MLGFIKRKFHNLKTLKNPQDAYRECFPLTVIFYFAFTLIFFGSCLIEGCSCTRKKKTKPLPPTIEFTVAIPEELLPTPTPTPQPEPIATPPEPKPIPTPKPKPVPKKDTFVKSTKIVEKKAPQPPKREVIQRPPKQVTPVKSNPHKLTAKEIQKLLDQGAKPSDRTSIPDDSSIQLLSIKNALYRAWIVPSAENLTGRPVEIEITLGSGGAIISSRILRSSGSRVLDQSALDATRAVRQIQGLSDAFIKSHRTVSIAFDLENN